MFFGQNIVEALQSLDTAFYLQYLYNIPGVHFSTLDTGKMALLPGSHPTPADVTIQVVTTPFAYSVWLILVCM